MPTRRRATRIHHAALDPNLVPRFQECEQAIEIHAHRRTGISVKSPFSPENNEEFKLLGGKYDKINNRWLLPRNEESRSKLEALFGAQSRNVVARVTAKDLVTVGKQLKLGGHVAANWDERQNRVTLAKAGVELLAGGWLNVFLNAVHVDWSFPAS